MTAVLNTLRGMGIPSQDIQTRIYSVAPQYDFVDGRQEFRGYRVEHIVEIKVSDINRLGSIIDAAVHSGANQVNGIEFTVTNPELYYQQALKAAMDDALAKAGTLASKLNIKVSRVPVQIIELGSEAPPIPLVYQSAASATPVQAGQIEITARIEAVFAYCQ